MQLVIDIDDEIYKEIYNGKGDWRNYVSTLIRTGRPLSTAHWIEHPKGIYAHLVCDNCLSSAPYDCRTNYCPNCGSKMNED